MIVFNLSCSHGHQFDGWFRTAEDFERQSLHVMVECPHCGDTHITKKLSAPRLNMGASEIAPALPQPSGPQEVMPASMMPGLQEHMLQQFKAFVRGLGKLLADVFGIGAHECLELLQHVFLQARHHRGGHHFLRAARLR